MGMVVGLGRSAGAERLFPLGFLNKSKGYNIFFGIGVIWTMHGADNRNGGLKRQFCAPDHGIMSQGYSDG